MIRRDETLIEMAIRSARMAGALMLLAKHVPEHSEGVNRKADEHSHRTAILLDELCGMVGTSEAQA